MSNRIKTVFLTAVILTMATNVHAEWKFGISAGLSNIDYDLLESWADQSIDLSTEGASSSDDIDAYSYSKGYDATELIFDLRNGPHAIAYKIANGSVSGWEDTLTVNGELYDWAADDYTSRSSNVDREEWTFSYAYTFGNNWTVSAGLYEGSFDYGYDSAWSDAYNEGTINEYSWAGSEGGLRDVTSEGSFLAIGYSNKITEKVFWFAKLGVQVSDIKSDYTYTFNNAFSATDPDFQAYAVGYFSDNYGMSNAAYTYSRTRIRETEGNATVFGLGLVYAFNPNDTITLEYESKSYSMDPAEEVTHDCAGAGFICDTAALSTDQMLLEEEASYLTLRYRHSF